VSRRRRPPRIPTAPSKTTPHKRNLIGPYEVLDRLQQAGGLPDEIISPGRPGPSAAAADATEYMRALGQWVEDSLDPEVAQRFSLPDDAMRRAAWVTSLTTSMRESVPKEKWCRHLRAADPKVTEIRSMAVLSAGRWDCVECLKQAGFKAGLAVLGANLWPNECDLCGAYTEKFNEISGNLSGCRVNANICDRCRSFLGAGPDG
jgi:hypothetical protein